MHPSMCDKFPKAEILEQWLCGFLTLIDIPKLFSMDYKNLCLDISNLHIFLLTQPIND